MDLARCYGDGMAFVRLLRFMQGEKDTFHDVAPVVWGDGDVELAIDMLGSTRQAQTEALAMLLRYKIIDKRFVQLLLGLLEVQQADESRAAPLRSVRD